MCFDTSKRLLNQLVDEELAVSLDESSRSTRGDVQTVGQFEGEDSEKQRYSTTQTTVHIVNDSGDIYAEAIIQIFNDMSVSLIDWIEVVDREHRGNSIGRALHEEAVRYIQEEKKDVNRIYTKIENPKMRGVNIDTGFQEIDTETNETWCRKDL